MEERLVQRGQDKQKGNESQKEQKMQGTEKKHISFMKQQNRILFTKGYSENKRC